MLIRKLYLSLFLLTTLLISGCGVSKQDSIYYDYIKSAGKKYKKGDYTASIEISRKAAEFDPKKFNAFACIADVFFMLEKYDSAIKEYDTAILINPSCGGCMFFKAEALGKLKRYDEATAAYSETIKKNYLKACCYNNRGNIKDHHKLYDAALKDYDSSISTSFYNHRFIYINKSDVYCGKEKYDSALLELDKCIKTDPKQLSFAAHIKNLNEQNLLKQSEALLKDTCFSKQMNCFVDAYTRKGYLDILLGKYKEASLYLNYERLLPIPSYTQLIYRSYIPFNTMQFDVSNQYLDSAIALDPKSGYGYMQKGNIRKLLGKYDEALGYYNKTIEVDTTTNSRYDNRGELYILMDSLDAAIADFNTAIKIDDNKPDPWEYNARGYAYFLKKQYKEALVDYDSAIKTAKNYYQPRPCWS